MAGLGRAGGSEELFLAYPARLGDWCGGKGSLRATSAHALTPRDLSKHETLLSSFSHGERHTERGGKGGRDEKRR